MRDIKCSNGRGGYFRPEHCIGGKVDLVTGSVSFKEVPIKDARYAPMFDILNIRILQI